jgi:EAL domain-containing protein (putative c-di-GMP-specific phosphodiesterase class I)
VADAKNYLRVRELLREKGYRICVDGVTHGTLKEIDQASLDVDFIKIHWDSQLVAMKSEMRARLRATPQSDNGPRFVITRVGTPDALAFGQSLDIRLFQGRYVDTFVDKDARLRELVRSNRGFQTAR